jgi:hypothetical protein
MEISAVLQATFMRKRAGNRSPAVRLPAGDRNLTPA